MNKDQIKDFIDKHPNFLVVIDYDMFWIVDPTTEPQREDYDSEEDHHSAYMAWTETCLTFHMDPQKIIPVLCQLLGGNAFST